MKERTAKGIWKNPEQGEKIVDCAWPVDWNWPGDRVGRVRGENKESGKRG